MAINKVIYDGKTLIDLTRDNISEDKLLRGYTAHGADGTAVTGICDFDVDSRDATALETQTLSGKTFYARGEKRTGTMHNNGGVSAFISEKHGQYVIPAGFHDGTGKVNISTAEQKKIISSNIREGICILGVVGSMTGTEGVVFQSKSVVPSAEVQTVLADEGYNGLSKITVEAIPYAENGNEAGGITVMIG